MIMAKAAYSIHAATGFSPFEIVFGLRERSQESTSTAVDKELLERFVNNSVNESLEEERVWKKKNREE